MTRLECTAQTAGERVDAFLAREWEQMDFTAMGTVLSPNCSLRYKSIAMRITVC